MPDKLILFCLFLIAPCLGLAQRSFRYTNPITRDTAISMRDHFIIKVGDQWYCTGTSDPVWTGFNPGMRLLQSDDLIHWKQQGWLIEPVYFKNGLFFIKGPTWTEQTVDY